MPPRSKKTTPAPVLKDPSSLKPHPDNPRRGDTERIKESIRANGFYGAVVVQKKTGLIIAGNHRVKAAIELGIDQVPVIEHDCDDATASRILLADNRTSDVAGYDEDTLRDLLIDATRSNNILGTGYEPREVEAKLAALARSDEAKAKTERTITPELMERHEYVVLYFDNDLDWQVARRVFDLDKTLHERDSRPGYERKGTGRVIPGASILPMLRDVTLVNEDEATS